MHWRRKSVLFVMLFRRSVCQPPLSLPLLAIHHPASHHYRRHNCEPRHDRLRHPTPDQCEYQCRRRPELFPLLLVLLQAHLLVQRLNPSLVPQRRRLDDPASVLQQALQPAAQPLILARGNTALSVASCPLLRLKEMRIHGLPRCWWQHRLPLLRYFLADLLLNALLPAQRYPLSFLGRFWWAMTGCRGRVQREYGHWADRADASPRQRNALQPGHHRWAARAVRVLRDHTRECFFPAGI